VLNSLLTQASLLPYWAKRCKCRVHFL
jgi:hypothetical protein